ncbi:hypothetical protein NPIL_180851 [Nephila pilipes]|uniref:Uncharacterized protein n=1 Tax=Nephila pilipes TaxID=299642 RepID=A0A8X6TB63_NEPPI|nr:hypothetical protein NPIL_180851 [Nephila pilipes]
MQIAAAKFKRAMIDSLVEMLHILGKDVGGCPGGKTGFTGGDYPEGQAASVTWVHEINSFTILDLLKQ